MGNSCCSKDDITDTDKVRGNISKQPPSEDAPYIIVVDPISTGAALAAECYRKANLIRVDVCLGKNMQDYVNPIYKHVQYKYAIQFDHQEPLFHAAVAKCAQELVEWLGETTPIACIAGAECGVEVAEMLADMLGIPSNDPSSSLSRRDKNSSSETVREAGVRAVAQKLCESWMEVKEFVDSTNFKPFEYIIKPGISAGSDNVRLCRSMKELRQGFDDMLHQKNVLGGIETSCLVQEFLRGQEYVLDTVSRNGKHKTVCIWKLDKRSANGSEFICFGMRMVSGATQEGRVLSEYVHSVLDALNITNSAGHTEVIMTQSNTPCLIESSATPHGANGNWIPMAKHCLGYTQVSAIADSWLDYDKFLSLPELPVPKNYCVEVMLVNRRAGHLVATPRWKDVEKLPTFYNSNALFKFGEFIPVTINLLTTPGSIILLGRTKAACERDFEAIRKWEQEDFYQYRQMRYNGSEGSPEFHARLCPISSPQDFRTPKSGGVFGAINAVNPPPPSDRGIVTKSLSPSDKWSRKKTF